MVYPLDKYVDAMIKLDLEPIQILFLQIIYERRHDLLYKIAKEGFIFPHAKLVELEEKGLVVNTNPSDKNVYADFYEVTDKFIAAYYTATMRDGEEFWSEYPAYINIDNKKIPAKGVNKEELVRWYHLNVGTKYDHEKVLAALRYAKQNRLINMRIDKWLYAESYLDLWTMMSDPQAGDLPHERIL